MWFRKNSRGAQQPEAEQPALADEVLPDVEQFSLDNDVETVRTLESYVAPGWRQIVSQGCRLFLAK